MESESLDNSAGIQSLEAENKHLKRMLNRFLSSKNDAGVDSYSQIVSHITELVGRGDAFDFTLVSCLKLIAEYYAADRVSYFAFDNLQRAFVAQKQWTNSCVQEYDPADLTIDASENPLSNSNVGNCFSSSNLKRDLAVSLADKFEIFSTQSLLFVPLSFGAHKTGMLVFESCLFSREWYDFEVKEITQVVLFLSCSLDALWHKHTASRVARLNTVRAKIVSKIRKLKGANNFINEALNSIGKGLDLKRVYIVSKQNDINREQLWLDTEVQNQPLLTLSDLEKLHLNQNDIQAHYLESATLSARGVDVVLDVNAVLISGLTITNTFGGWLLGEFVNDQKYAPEELVSLWNEIAVTLSDTLSEQAEDQERNRRYAQLLKQNQELTIRNLFMEKVFETSPMAILLISNDKVKYANKQADSFMGFSSREGVGKDTMDIHALHLSMQTMLVDFCKSIGEDGVVEGEMEMADEAGALIQIGVYGTRIHMDGQDSYLVFAQDITASYQSLQTMKESSERYQKIMDSAIDGAILIDAANRIRYVNKSACSLLGWHCDEFMQFSALDIIQDNYRPVFEQAIHHVSGGKEFKGTMVMCHKEGSKVEVEWAGTLIYIDRQPYGYFTIHDVSERKKYEKALADSEKEFSTLAQNCPDIILRLNRVAEIQFFNQAFINTFKLNEAERIVGKTLEKLGILNPLFAPTWKTKVSDVFLFGETVLVEQGFSDKQEEVYFEWILSPENNNEGEVDTVLAIGRNLAPRKHAEKELMQAKQKAEESNKLKTEFLANISHELRTPLNAIVGFSSLLRGCQIPSDEVDEYVDVIHKNSDSLMNLVNNIIDVAKIESGKISVVKENINLGKLLDDLYHYYSDKIDIEHKGRVKLYCTIPEGADLALVSDPIRLRQVLVNLIGNAIKFTIKGFIEFGFTSEKYGLRFFVKDTGIGISTAKQQDIFQPFCKGQEDSDRLYAGTGVGLAICEKLVNALGGNIGLISEVGKGSEFFFTHPLQKKSGVALPPKQIFKVSNPVLQKNYYWPDKMMLLVDENSSTHLQMRKFIEHTGITLISARTAAGASKLLMNRKDIHLVLMDMTFPDSDGAELVKIMKQLNSKLPVIAHTACAINADDMSLRAGGFDASIAKPADKDELLLLMDRFLVEA